MPEPGSIFGRSVNPIPTGEGRLFPPTTGTPHVFHLPASLNISLLNHLKLFPNFLEIAEEIPEEIPEWVKDTVSFLEFMVLLILSVWFYLQFL